MISSSFLRLKRRLLPTQRIKLLSLSPAKRMGIADRKGSIEVGKDADLVIVDEKLQIQNVIVNGEVKI